MCWWRGVVSELLGQVEVETRHVEGGFGFTVSGREGVIRWGFDWIRVGGWNVGSLTGKLFELADALGRHKVDIACFKETRWKGSRTREGNGYKLWYSGSTSARNGVGVILAADLKDNVVHVNRCSDRIMAITLVIEEETVNIISAYAPQVGLSDAEKRSFWDSLDELVRECPSDQRLFIGGDLNGHIGAVADGYAGVHGGFGYRVRNDEGSARLTISWRMANGLPRILWKKLIGHKVEEFTAKVSEGLSARTEDLMAMEADQMWYTLAGIIKDAAKESLGVASGTASTQATHRESWWFCEEVQSKVTEKQSRFRELLLSRGGNLADRVDAEEKYKAAKREAKKAVAQAKDKAYEALYKNLNSKEGVNDIFRIAKARERRSRDFGNIRFIKDEDGRSIVNEEDIRRRWGDYFSSLFNERDKPIDHKIKTLNPIKMVSSSIVNTYPLSSYSFGTKEPKMEKDTSVADRLARMKLNYMKEGMRTSVEAILLVQEHNHPHILLLQIGNTFCKLPGGRLKPGENEIEGLKRKLSSKLAANSPNMQPNWQVCSCTIFFPLGKMSSNISCGRLKPGENEIEGLKRKLSSKLAANSPNMQPNWQIGECVAVWWRPNFETIMYPYCPPHISKPKECKKLYVVHLSEREYFAVPKNLKLLAVPLFELYDNVQRYGPVISTIPQQLSRFQFNMIAS
ncbi:cleavage/polyadenylation specificity factor, 25kDa subunit [Artemisia annua]|uniref:Cleavage/polyadenylation specificity factor, 25kDa subunit n=1 Tax=Artemisia annua TaxID=35608 RepID=A0A2U1NRN3_ARTAN|nr:cleavage/polyadenylation specificity factor, 25kDa subunit [Artemisia annua]